MITRVNSSREGKIFNLGQVYVRSLNQKVKEKKRSFLRSWHSVERFILTIWITIVKVAVFVQGFYTFNNLN